MRVLCFASTLLFSAGFVPQLSFAQLPNPPEPMEPHVLQHALQDQLRTLSKPNQTTTVDKSGQKFEVQLFRLKLKNYLPEVGVKIFKVSNRGRKLLSSATSDASEGDLGDLVPGSKLHVVAISNNRILVGAERSQCSDRCRNVYSFFEIGDQPAYRGSIVVSEKARKGCTPQFKKGSDKMPCFGWTGILRTAAGLIEVVRKGTELVEGEYDAIEGTRAAGLVRYEIRNGKVHPL